MHHKWIVLSENFRISRYFKADDRGKNHLFHRHILSPNVGSQALNQLNEACVLRRVFLNA